MYHYVRKPWDMYALIEFVTARDKTRHQDGSFASFDPFGFDMVQDVDVKGHDLIDVRSSEDARFQCLLDTKCAAVTCYKSRCYLKSFFSTDSGSQKKIGALTYVKRADATPIQDGYLVIRDADIFKSNIKKIDSRSKDGLAECDANEECRAVVKDGDSSWLKSSIEISDMRYLPGPTLYVKLYGDGEMPLPEPKAPKSSLALFDAAGRFDVKGNDIGDGYLPSPISAQSACIRDVRCEGFVCLHRGEAECYLKSSTSTSLRQKMSDAVLYTRRTSVCHFF